MSKKNSIKKAAALLLGLALTVGATGCDFIRTDNMKDLNQSVATVNIASLLTGKDADYADDLNSVIDLGGVGTNIPKRDLVSYFMNYGYTYVQSYGYTYEDTFNMLLDMLVSRKIVTQYAVVYYLKEKGLKVEGLTDSCEAFIASELTNPTLTAKEKELLAAHPEVSAMKYFLTENGAREELFDETLYQMNAAINSQLDTSEAKYITASSENHDHGTPRTTPTGAGVEKSEFYIAPHTDSQGEVERYEVYTGMEQNGVPYGYEALDGSTRTTRMKAYNDFIANLDENGLIKKGDNTSVFREMDYYYVELASRLEQALIVKYTDDLIEQGEGELTKDNPNDYLTARYEETFEAQKKAYENNYSAFETAIGAISDTKFVTYSPVKNYGFVYNILIPFSEEQNRLFAAEEARSTSDADLYKYRAGLLSNVKAKDLRTTWFSEHDHANYAFDATTVDGYEYYNTDYNSSYVFFEDNFTNNERYEELNVYLGQYPFNGSVTKTQDGDFKLKSNVLTIDSFMAEMEGYLEHAVGAGSVVKKGHGMFQEDGTFKNNYVGANSGSYAMNDDDTFADYSQFVYYSGKVDVGTVTAANYFDPTTKGYAAAAAFNELMFAYSTDTGCLNTYMGYVVSPFTTSYVAEFEYAAQWAIKQGAGTYVVCPSTYGWHVIYVTYVYGEGDVYGGFNIDDMDKEGTFSHLYAEAMKANYSTEYANDEQTRLILAFDNDSCVTRHEKAYKDLLELDE